MPSTTNTDLLFCCPSCGADMRASGRDAGSVMGCLQCGESVRIPRHPHPVEAPTSIFKISTPDAVQSAWVGLLFLRISVYLLLLEYCLLAATYTYWVQVDGPAAVLRRQSGTLLNGIVIIWVIELFLVCARTGCRWWGYSQWEDLAEHTGTRFWVAIARYATLLRTAGYLLISWPWLAGHTWPLTGLAAASVKLGQFAWMLGVGLEFAVLVPWYRLLKIYTDDRTARRVINYGTWNVVGLFLGLIGTILLGMLILMLVRAEGNWPDGPSRVNPIEIPASGWNAAAAFLLIVGVFWLWLAMLQLRLLRTLEQALPKMS